MGNQPCCVSSLRRDQMYPDFLCNSPPTSSHARHLPQVPSIQNPPASRTFEDQLTDPNSIFYKPLTVPSTLTPDEEAKALTSKRKKVIRKKKPPPLNNIESPKEYTATSNTFFLTNNPFDNYTEPSYKITTTQGEVGMEAQEDLTKKIGTEYWENEEDKNLSVRLSDKRLSERTAAFAGQIRSQNETLNPAKDILSAGMVAQKIGEEEEYIDNDFDEDEIRFDPYNNESLKRSRPKASNETQSFLKIPEKEDQTSRRTDEGGLLSWDIRPTVIYEEPEVSLVRATSNSYSSNPRDKSSDNKHLKENKNERTTTEETTRRYSEYMNKLQENSTAMKHNDNLVPQRDLTPFNISDGVEEPTIRIPETVYEASVVHFSRSISPQKEQGSPSRFDDSIYSADQTGKSRKRQDENTWDVQRSLVELSVKNNGEVPIENFSGTFRKASHQDPLIKDRTWVDQIESATSQQIDQVNALRERAIATNNSKSKNVSLGSVHAYENGKEDMLSALGNRNYVQSYQIPGADYSRSKVKKAEGSERWESVQKDVQKLIDNAFKPRTSLLDHYLKPVKEDTRKSGIHKPKVSWKEQLEGRSEYTNPFSNERSRGSVTRGSEIPYELRASEVLDKANKSVESYSSQDRRGYIDINVARK